MAVTITQTPQLFTPSDNPARFTFSSNQTAQPNFSFIVEVYLNGVLDSRREILPERSNAAHIDLEETLTAVTPVLEYDVNELVRDAANYISFHVIIKERYGGTPAYGASATSSTFYAFKACLDLYAIDTFDYLKYTVGLSSRKFLTDNTLDLDIPKQKDYRATIITNNTANLALFATLKDENGTTVTTFTENLPVARICEVNLNSKLIVDETAVTQLQMDSTASVEFKIIETIGSTAQSQTKTLNYVENDCGVDSHTCWLNMYGAFDCFTFTHNRINSTDIQEKSFERQTGDWDGGSFNYTPGRGGEVVYLKTMRDKMQLVSGFIKEDVQHYLVGGLYEASLVYLHDRIRQRIKVINTGYIEQNDLHDEEFTEIAEVRLVEERKSIRL